jgi:hypothetical protein
MLRGVRIMFGAEPGDRLDRFFKPAGSTPRHPFQALAVTGRHMQGALRVPPGSCCGDSQRTAAHAREIGGRLIRREPVEYSSGPANPGLRGVPSHRVPSIDQYP